MGQEKEDRKLQKALRKAERGKKLTAKEKQLLTQYQSAQEPKTALQEAPAAAEAEEDVPYVAHVDVAGYRLPPARGHREVGDRGGHTPRHGAPPGLRPAALQRRRYDLSRADKAAGVSFEALLPGVRKPRSPRKQPLRRPPL